jgi:hypothetical protein
LLSLLVAACLRARAWKLIGAMAALLGAMAAVFGGLIAAITL